MIGLTEAIIGGALYLLWKGGVIKKTETAKAKADAAKPKSAQVKPVDVSWPTVEPPVVPPGALTEKKIAVHQAESDLAQQKAQLDREVVTARKKAGGDLKAQRDITAREAARRKALADYERDVEAAKRS
jgi:hypothetical protein